MSEDNLKDSEPAKTITFSCPADPDKFPERYTLTIDKAYVDPKNLYLRPGRFIPITHFNDQPSRKRRWFENSIGCRWVYWNRHNDTFIFNEGGRGLTLTIARWCPFRLYVAGYVFIIHNSGQWSFRKRK
jgi:hypothetical protein